MAVAITQHAIQLGIRESQASQILVDGGRPHATGNCWSARRDLSVRHRTADSMRNQ